MSIKKSKTTVLSVKIFLCLIFQTGINEGYLTRPCIDPLDTMCPSKAPNYFEACESIAFFKKYSQQSNVSIDEVLKPYESTPEVKSSDNSLMDIFGALCELQIFLRHFLE